ncbi:MAG: hypothetical protein HKN23_12235 [Verrucomicrobiales bacterium]|nr:hypothetical protein [Verrucomicrobiales bacterium]
MTLIEKYFALKQIPFFSRIDHEELLLVANVALVRKYNSESPVLEKGADLNRLIVVVEGSIHPIHTPEKAREVIGIEPLVMEEEIGVDLVAGKSGAVCLNISKGHLFTIINEFPSLLTEYLLESEPSE